MRKMLLALLPFVATSVLAVPMKVTENANLRGAPTTSSGVKAVIPKGAKLNAGTCAQNWCSVTYQGKTGYVSQKLLKRTTPSPQTIPTLPASTDTYTNVDGQQIQRPTFSATKPAGASAKCRDGSYSFSTHRRGTCSRHGGVDIWY